MNLVALIERVRADETRRARANANSGAKSEGAESDQGAEKHVQLLSCFDGEFLQGIQVKATNSNFTNDAHNDDFRFRDDVNWIEYVQYPTYTNGSWSWATAQYGPSKYCNEGAWRDHLMHKEQLRAYESHQTSHLKSKKDHPPQKFAQQHAVAKDNNIKSKLSKARLSKLNSRKKSEEKKQKTVANKI